MKLLVTGIFSSVLLLQPATSESGQGRGTVSTIDGDHDSRSWLGVSIQDMTPRLAKSMDVEATQGALVNNVIDDSPAKNAGIREEDIIIEFDGHAITTAEDLVKRVANSDPDKEVSLVLMRGNERKGVLVRLEEPHERHPFSFRTRPRIAPRVHVFMSHSSLGMEVQELSDQLSDYFGAPHNEGVLITEVDEKSTAAKAGLKAGDVILKIGSQTIHETDDIWDEVEEYEKGETVSVEILRERSRKTLTMEMEETPGRYWFKGPKSDRRFEFDYDFDDEWKGRFDDELRWQRDRTRGELERLKICLNDLGESIRNLGDYLKERFKAISRVDS